MANDCIPYYDDADEITGHCTSAVTGKRFVKVSGTQQVGRAGLSTTADGGNVKIAPGTANAAALGVAMMDCASGSKVGVYCVGSGVVVPVTADSAVTYGDLIVVGTAGKAKTRPATGAVDNLDDLPVTVGIALDSAADGEDVPVKLI